jgi:hypothetical protein
MTAATRARLIHNIAVGAAMSGLSVLVTFLNRYNATILNSPLGVKVVVFGVLAAAASASIGVVIANGMKDDPPAPPSSPNIS